MLQPGRDRKNAYLLSAIEKKELIQIHRLITDFFFMVSVSKTSNAEISGRSSFSPGCFAHLSDLDIFPVEKKNCHIEAMGNMDQLPIDHGFTVSVLPVKMEKASASWTRCVAIIWDS